MIFIYGLFDPRDGSLRYIGKTINLKNRLREHLMESGENPYKDRWIGSLKTIGLCPEATILDTVDDTDWQFWEQWYVEYFRGLGCRLTNIAIGGISPPSRKGTTITDKHKEAIRNFNLGAIRTKEARLKMSIAMRGNTNGKGKRDESLKEKLRLINTGKITSSSVRDKISSSRRGYSDNLIININNLILCGWSCAKISREMKIPVYVVWDVKSRKYRYVKNLLGE